MGKGSEIALKNRIVSISWKTWTEGRKKEELPYKEFYKKYDYLKDSHVWEQIVEVTDELNLGSSISWNEEEGKVTIKRIK
jgi:hypothetical protein|tara:strand:+ start:346 stop:585 length:240 start_codon:yes stop_codon:yes gene_type:complete